MPRNVEIKARLTDERATLERIQSLGATGPEALTQTDTFFHVPVGRLKLREFGDGLCELIFYERADIATAKVSEYVRVSAPDPIVLHDVLTRSLGVRATVRKHRAVYFIGQTRIHVDAVDGLGSFIEFEVVLGDGQSVADGEQIAGRVMDALSISSTDLIPQAYVDLLERVNSVETDRYPVPRKSHSKP